MEITIGALETGEKYHLEIPELGFRAELPYVLMPASGGSLKIVSLNLVGMVEWNRFFGTRMHLGLPIGLAAALLIWFLLARTRWGYEIRVAGANPKAARYARIDIQRSILWVMLISGGLAGLAGIH